MALKLRPVRPSDYEFLYQLLEEKTPQENISHTKLPTWEEHCTFNDGIPYKEDYIIGDNFGRVYLTYQGEIGIHISIPHRQKGIASQVLDHFIARKVPLLANISPLNRASIDLFTSKGFTLFQLTYKHGG